MSFENLIAEMSQMAKSLPVAAAGEGDEDDAAIQAAAGEDAAAAATASAAGATGGQGGVKRAGAKPTEVEAGEGGGGGEPLRKSFKVQLSDGSEGEAYDATEILEALQGRVESTEESVLKALGMSVDLIKAQGAQLAEQASLLKKLNADLARIAGEGRGRKAIVSVPEKPSPTETLAKSEPAGVTRDEFFLKAEAAQKAGRITGLEVATAESYLNRGLPVPAQIIQRVLA